MRRVLVIGPCGSGKSTLASYRGNLIRLANPHALAVWRQDNNLG